MNKKETSRVAGTTEEVKKEYNCSNLYKSNVVADEKTGRKKYHY